MGQRCDCGMATHLSLFLLEVGSISSLSLLYKSDFIQGPCLWVLRVSCFVGLFWKVPPTSYLLRFPVSILSVGPQGFSPFPSPNTRSGSLLPATPALPCPLSLPGPFLTPHLWLLPSPSLTWALQLVEPFEFCGLYLVYSVFFSYFFFILWLISTY